MPSYRGWVIDASVALKWSLRDEDFLEEADSLYQAFLTRAIDMVAPHYARYEVASSLNIASLQGRIDAQSAEQRLRLFFQTEIAAHEDDETLLLEAMRLASQQSIAVYDAIYVALAERLDFAMVTADRRLHDHLEPRFQRVHLIKDIPALL